MNDPIKRKMKTPPIVDAQLYDTEELLWWGQPRPDAYARQVVTSELFSGLMIGGFAIVLIVTIGYIHEDFSMIDGPFQMVQIMFWLVPLIMILSSLWIILAPLRRYISATKITYAVTNKRALIINEWFQTKIDAYYDEHMTRLQVQVNADGSGNIIFAQEQQLRRRRQRYGSHTYTVTINHGFFGVENVREVEDLISQTFFENSPNVVN